MSKLHNAMTMVLVLGVGLLGADRLRHSGPDRELVKQIEELRQAQKAAHANDGQLHERQERYAVPTTQMWVDQALPKDEVVEKNGGSPEAEATKPAALKMEDVQLGLDREFYAAPRDRGWAADAENTVRNALRRTVAEGTQVESVHCNGSVCRIESTHASTTEYQKFVETSLAGTNSGMWNGAVFSSVVRDENGDVTVVSFVAREGTSLPRIGQM